MSHHDARTHDREPRAHHRGAPINPFAVRHHAPGRLPFLFDPARGAGSAAELWERFEACGRRGEIVGPHGTGKSTLLRTLRAEASRRGARVALVQLRAGEPWWPRVGALPAAATLLLDGAERLSWPIWKALLALGRCRRLGLIATVHRRRDLPELYRTAVDEELAEEVTRRVLAASPAAPRLVAAAEARASLASNGGDLREALFQLYELYEERYLESAQVARQRSGPAVRLTLPLIASASRQ